MSDAAIVECLDGIGSVEGRLKDAGGEVDGVELRHVVGVDEGRGHHPAFAVSGQPVVVQLVSTHPTPVGGLIGVVKGNRFVLKRIEWFVVGLLANSGATDSSKLFRETNGLSFPNECSLHFLS